ncbi:MAG: DDE-type integrase/transposase/recombinase, partial [Pseudomonadota bacterium]
RLPEVPERVGIRHREALIAADALDALFDELDRAINQAGFIPRAGQIVDASMIAAPKQRNTDGEKAAIKAGKSAQEIWPDKPAKAAQKDTDGRWTVKYSKAKTRIDGTKQIDIAIPVYGYKSHISIDRKYLNNRIEADHAALKHLLRPKRDFRKMTSAKNTLKGIETHRAIKKGHFANNQPGVLNEVA